MKYQSWIVICTDLCKNPLKIQTEEINLKNPKMNEKLGNMCSIRI